MIRVYSKCKTWVRKTGNQFCKAKSLYDNSTNGSGRKDIIRRYLKNNGYIYKKSLSHLMIKLTDLDVILQYMEPSVQDKKICLVIMAGNMNLKRYIIYISLHSCHFQIVLLNPIENIWRLIKRKIAQISVVRRYWNFGKKKYWNAGVLELEYWNTGILKKYSTPVFPHHILCVVHQGTTYNDEQNIIWNLENKIGIFVHYPSTLVLQYSSTIPYLKYSRISVFSNNTGSNTNK